jgi:hypothetical protein
MEDPVNNGSGSQTNNVDPIGFGIQVFWNSFRTYSLVWFICETWKQSRLTKNLPYTLVERESKHCFSVYFRMLYKLDIDIRRTGRAHHFDLQRIVELVVRSHFCVCFVFFVSFRIVGYFLYRWKQDRRTSDSVVFSMRPRLGFSIYYIEEHQLSTYII